MLQKGIGHFLGRRYNLPLAIMRTGTKLNDSGPYRNMFFESVTYNNDLAPFQGASAGWAETFNKAVRPEWARDGVGEMPFECYRKGLGIS